MLVFTYMVGMLAFENALEIEYNIVNLAFISIVCTVGEVRDGIPQK